MGHNFLFVPMAYRMQSKGNRIGSNRNMIEAPSVWNLKFKDDDVGFIGRTVQLRDIMIDIVLAAKTIKVPLGV